MSRGVTTLLRTNKNKATTIKDEQRRKRRGVTTTCDFNKMK
jgi:hypothetical protein